MRVEAFRTYQVTIPLQPPVLTAIHRFAAIENVLLEVDAGGATGIGYAWAFVARQAHAIRTLVEDLADQLIGREVAEVRAIWHELWSRINYIGQAGPPVMALAVVDTALWDLFAQEAGMPLYRLLGAMRNEVPVYATGGWLSFSPDELVAQGIAVKAAGYAGFKIKVGSVNWQADVDRVRLLRQAVGRDLPIMVDANQAWGADDAIRFGRAVEEYRVGWLEEPVAADDLESSARVAAALDMPVAAGETLFTRQGFKRLIDAQAADILTPDVMRCAGPTEFMQVSALADAHRLPICSHTLAEVSAHLIAACPNGTFVECVPGWWDPLFDPPPKLVAGHMQLGDAPGLGFTFSREIMASRGADR